MSTDIHLRRRWIPGPQFDEGGFSRVFEATAEDGTSAVVKLIPKLTGADRELRELRSEREKERMASTHEGCKQARESGALEEFLKANSNYETAYALHTLRNGGPKSDADSVDQRVREVLASRRAASVDKPGVTSAKGVRVIKGARNWQEAFDLAMKAHEKGETNLKFER